MGTNGIVPEHMLIRALDVVLTKQLEEPGWTDAIVMSLGYYNETVEDLEYSSGLKQLLVKLGQAGVAVFAAAGNDATDRPSYPAGFAADSEFAQSKILPLMSVAALNPDRTLAAFSNDGPWVNSAALGVSLVSSSPMIDASRDAGIQAGGRATVDEDDFRGGYGVWSGTSFAAPVLAGRYLNMLAEDAFVDTFANRRALLVALQRSPEHRAEQGHEVTTTV
jgi:hypothetical protein